METKSLFASRTFWFNLLAALALAVQQFVVGWPIDAEWQAAVLAIVNVVLRLVTHHPVVVRKPKEPGNKAQPPLVTFLVVAGLAGMLVSCAGATIRCDDPTLVLKDGTAENQTRLVVECGGQEIASQEVDLGELAGSQMCSDPSLVLRGEDALGLSRIELVCGGQVLAEFRVDLGFMRVREPTRSDERDAPDVPDASDEPDVPDVTTTDAGVPVITLPTMVPVKPLDLEPAAPAPEPKTGTTGGEVG